MAFLQAFISINACKQQKEVLDEGNAYMRFINLTPRSTHFYLDGIINVNDDTAIYGFQGDPDPVYNITTDYSGTPISTNIPISIATITRIQNIDLIGQRNVGVYTFGRIGMGNYFPNSTHRVPLAPIINGIDYAKYAQVRAGSREFTFAPSIPTVINGLPTRRVLEPNYQAKQVLNKGSYNTFILAERRLSYVTAPEVALLRIPETPESYNFDDSTAYVRFFNFTDINQTDERFNLVTDTVDVYYVKLIEGQPVGPEQPVNLGLIRFNPDVNKSTYFAINMRDLLKSSVSGKDDLDPRISQYTYRFRFYRTGFSEISTTAGGKLAEFDFIYSYRPESTINNPRQEVFGGLYSANEFYMVINDPRKLQTTISNVLFNLDKPLTNDPLLRPTEGLFIYNLQRANSIEVYLED